MLLEEEISMISDTLLGVFEDYMSNAHSNAYPLVVIPARYSGPGGARGHGPGHLSEWLSQTCHPITSNINM